jgi:hypothetical protein
MSRIPAIRFSAKAEVGGRSRPFTPTKRCFAWESSPGAMGVQPEVHPPLSHGQGLTVGDILKIGSTLAVEINCDLCLTYIWMALVA